MSQQAPPQNSAHPPGHEAESPTQIPPCGWWQVTRRAPEREFVFAPGGGEAHGMTLWTVNGAAFDPQRMDADPRPGHVELWRIGPATSRTRSTFIWRSSRCSPRAAASPGPSTGAGRTR